MIIRFFIHHLRLFLIMAMVLSPVQHLFAAQASIRTDSPTAVVKAVVASDMAQRSVLKTLDEDCGKHGKNGSCQNSNQCGNCPLPLGISQITPKCAEVNAQIQPAIPDISLYNADLLPDYRPPRYS